MVSELAEEKANLLDALGSAEDEVRQQREEISSCRGTIVDLTNQLASSHR
jgi:hypothetical protein